MKSKMKQLLIALVLLISSIAASAQDKYDYASVSFDNYLSFQTLVVSYTNKPTEVANFKEKSASRWDLSILLQQVDKMQSEGWELFSDHVTGVNASLVYTYNFRKKK